MNPLPPLTLYVHLPWCVQRCPYCDFNSHALKESLPEQAYLAALSRDLDFAVAELETPRPLEAIFFGGGTPSLFSAEGIGRFIEHVSRSLPLDEDIEITLEANPGTIERGRFADYRAASINRVSLGVQSFDDVQLKTLGRIHDADAAHRAIDELHAAGLENFNIDLMFGLPGQNVPAALTDIEQAIAARPAHISHYELTMEPNTLFAVRPPANLPDDEQAAEIAAACRERLVDAGFHRYEISAWSVKNRASRHNLNYWRFGDYLAIGAGAHGKLTAAGGRITRSARHRHPRDYQAHAGGEMAVAERREVGPQDCVLEYMLNNSRLVEGGHPAAFTRLTGLDAERWLMPGVRRGLAIGLLQHRSDGGWQPTPRGLEMLNDLQGLFLPEELSRTPLEPAGRTRS